jgi:hypothetical protein
MLNKRNCNGGGVQGGSEPLNLEDNRAKATTLLNLSHRRHARAQYDRQPLPDTDKRAIAGQQGTRLREVI